jgi:hypothetical protein
MQFLNVETNTLLLATIIVMYNITFFFFTCAILPVIALKYHTFTHTLGS